MKTKNILTYILILLMTTLLLTGCFEDTELPPDYTLYKFQKAYNEQDYNKMLEYIEPRAAKGIKGLMKIAGDIVGIDSQAFLDAFPLLCDFAEAESDIEMPMLDFDFDNAQVEIDGDMATIVLLEKSSDMVMIFYLKKEDDVWYLTLD